MFFPYFCNVLKFTTLNLYNIKNSYGRYEKKLLVNYKKINDNYPSNAQIIMKLQPTRLLVYSSTCQLKKN